MTVRGLLNSLSKRRRLSIVNHRVYRVWPYLPSHDVGQEKGNEILNVYVWVPEGKTPAPRTIVELSMYTWFAR